MKKVILLSLILLSIGCSQSTEQSKPTKPKINEGISVCTSQNEKSVDKATLLVSRDKEDHIKLVKWIYKGVYLGSIELQKQQPNLTEVNTWVDNEDLSMKTFNFFNHNNDVSVLNNAIEDYTKKHGLKLDPITVEQARLFNKYDFYYTVENDTLFYVAKFTRDYDMIEKLHSKDYLNAIMIHDQAELGLKINDSGDVSAQKYIDTVHTYPTEFAQALGIDNQVDVKCSNFK